MRRKIEVTTDEPLESEGSPVSPDSHAPEFGDHVDPAGHENDRPAESGLAAYITALQAEISDLRAQKEDAERRVLYSQAELQNFRRRKEDEARDLQRFSNAELIKSLLPILDNFERALAAAEQSKNFDALIGGVSGTLKQLQAFLQKAGVKPIDAIGKEFDPNFHEAIGHAESDEYAANHVAEEVQKGYILNDRVLRPTLVKVSQG